MLLATPSGVSALPRLPNDPPVSIEESMLASRHHSVAAQRPYMLADGASEAARFMALGLKK